MPKKQNKKDTKIVELYHKLNKELFVLETEGGKKKKKIKSIIDRAKMKNVLHDILNQSE